ncbi:hypothetical protein [Microcoleus asticus]|uniref:hypothetical protein n=1 Tax=Microcoleus asticus TaxID=2815231 RepID=UPI001553B8ED|nr:hypothetical protein [Microcoleus asticus]
MERRVLFCRLESKQKEEGRRKKEEGRRKKEEGRRKKEEGKCSHSHSFNYQECPNRQDC